MMAERSNRKIPVTERQFLWVQDDDKGEVILHVGPTMVSPTAADRVVVDDGQGGFREDTSGRPQRMVELSDSQYAVLYNPLVEAEEGPNGRFRPGRNESRMLRNGTRHMIPGPCSFYWRPGQRVEVRDAHELASNQYLVVKVYGEVDVRAPYYEITARSARITTATAEHSGQPQPLEGSPEDVTLTRGQLIVIRGLDTQFYIPPTGVDVVPDLSIDAGGTRLTAEIARKLLRSMPAPAPTDADDLPPEALSEIGLQPEEMVQQMVNFAVEEQALDDGRNKRYQTKAAPRKVAKVEQAARRRQAVPSMADEVERESSEDAIDGISREDVNALLQSDVHRRALEREVRKARLVRQAVVLGEKEFCVILDADGKKQIKVGPARVFPGPYDSFMTTGSDNRIYYAYELLPQRGLWLRFISPISRDRLEKRLPRSVELDRDEYSAGDELLLTGVNSFFFPFNEIEILHPLTGQPHVGNNHTDVFIEAIGIDQKSGIYVRDLSTGEARLVRGKQSYMVDPRKEVHITRSVPPALWNLIIGENEPHKRATSTMTTPWAISVTVPHNMACLAASSDGQRVIEGPCVALLEYEETLVPMTLSTNVPKTDTNVIRTCFLRTRGNRITDIVRIETSDFVEIDVKVSYRVTFEPDLKEKWFNHENYVGLLCDHMRSLVRNRCRQIGLTELWTNLSTIIRDIVLGERTDKGRNGRLFPDNGFRVTEVEVLTAEILDAEIGQFLESVQRESVALVISDRQAAEKLRSDKLRHQIDAERLEMRRDASERQSTIEDLLRQLEHRAQQSTLQQREALAHLNTDLEASRLALALQKELERDADRLKADLDRVRVLAEIETTAEHLRHLEEQEHQLKLTELEISLIQAQSHASVAERQAIQPALVEALTAAGDKVLLGEVAANMNLVSLFKGKDVGTIFADVLGNLPVKRTVQRLLAESGEVEED